MENVLSEEPAGIVKGKGTREKINLWHCNEMRPYHIYLYGERSLAKIFSISHLPKEIALNTC